jgi:collagenase-like PrtC family protease
MTQPFDYKQTTKQYRKIVDAQVAGYISQHPELTNKELGKLFNCSETTIHLIAHEHGIPRKKGPKNASAPVLNDEAV